MLQSQDKKAVEAEMREKTSSYQNDKLEFIKNPVVVEFLGLTPDASFNETKLESSIITNLQNFYGNGKRICVCCETATHPH